MTRSRLRPWSEDDLDALLVAVRAEDVALQLGLTPGDDDAVRAVLDQRRGLVGPKAYAFAIDVDGRAVGEVGISSIEPRHRTAWLSYWLAPDARGSGLATCAVATVVDWAFETLDLFRLELGYRVNNPSSGAVARRAGFVVEGTERARLEYDGVRYDVETCARLRSDPAPDLKLLTIESPPARVA